MRAAKYTGLKVWQESGVWRVQKYRGEIGMLDEADRAEAEAAHNSRVAKLEQRIVQFDLAWQQELQITASLDGITPFACGEALAERALSQPEKTHHMAGMKGEISRFVVETALERGGAKVAGAVRRRASLAAAGFAATLGALCAAAWLCLRSLGWPRLKDTGNRTIIAMHAEAANRTRHIRKALVNRTPKDTAVLIVGRLHVSAAQAQALLAQQGWSGDYALAWDWRAVLGGLGRGFAILGQSSAVIYAAGFRPTFSQLTAMKLRILLGAGSAWRWNSRARAAKSVVFGHVGRSDTILLEQAIQKGGAKTAHWMHGLSVGHAYQGVSDMCINLCRHDDEWHGRTLNYRANASFPIARPPFRSGTKPGWVVLTNMTHYGYTYFPSIGPEHELRLIRIVAEMAKRKGLDPALVTWKPHPVFYQSDPVTRAAIVAALAEHGFTLWPEELMPFDYAAQFETVIVGPSGIVFDMMKQGRLPVLAEFQPIQPEHATALCQPKCHDVSSLEQALSVVHDPVRAAMLYEQIWDQVGPGMIPALSEVETLLRAS